MNIKTGSPQIGNHRIKPAPQSLESVPKSSIQPEALTTEATTVPLTAEAKQQKFAQQSSTVTSGPKLATEDQQHQIDSLIENIDSEVINTSFEGMPALSPLEQELNLAKSNLKSGPRSLEQIDQEISSQPMERLKVEATSLKENTGDDAQAVDKITTKNFSNDVTRMFSVTADKMDNSLDKKKYLKRAENEAKQWVENMSPAGEDNWALTLKTDKELRNEVALGLVDMKPKYKQAYEAKVTHFEKQTQDRKVLIGLKDDIAKTSPGEERVAATEKYRNAYLEYGKTYFPQMNIVLKPNEIPTLPRAVEQPLPESVLSSSKINLLNSISKGIQSAQRPNHLTQTQEGDTKGLMMGAMIDMKIVVPEKMNFGGEDFSLVKKLGAGGDGMAYLMESDTGKKLVVKAAPFQEGDRENIEQNFDKFAQELKAHKHAMGDGNTGHDNMINLLGAVRHGDHLLTVTEFAEGGELKDVAESIGQAPISDKNKQLLNRHMLRDAMQGMDYVGRERNMGHYDIKPDNFFVREDGTVTVADFGRATLDHQGVQLESTPAYLSPELSTYDSSGNEKSDIWSLGVMVNEVVKGENPFKEISTNEFFENNNSRQLQNVSSEKGNLSAVDQLINSMTHKDPAQRPNINTVLNHSYFQDPELNQPEVKQLLQAIIAGDDQQIQRLNQQLS